MPYLVARLGDTSDHGGQIITASTTLNVGESAMCLIVRCMVITRL
jgi:uncharacterized Zn-binding protein involved in type VI secretion